MVVLEAWADGLDFERAHFSDAALAAGIMATGLAPARTTAAGLEAELVDARRGKKSIDSVWARWPEKPAKPDLALLLWPVLKERIEGSLDDAERLRQVPIARVLLQAYELAVRTPRRHVVFRVARQAE